MKKWLKVVIGFLFIIIVVGGVLLITNKEKPTRPADCLSTVRHIGEEFSAGKISETLKNYFDFEPSAIRDYEVIFSSPEHEVLIDAFLKGEYVFDGSSYCEIKYQPQNYSHNITIILRKFDYGSPEHYEVFWQVTGF